MVWMVINHWNKKDMKSVMVANENSMAVASNEKLTPKGKLKTSQPAICTEACRKKQYHLLSGEKIIEPQKSNKLENILIEFNRAVLDTVPFVELNKLAVFL